MNIVKNIRDVPQLEVDILTSIQYIKKYLYMVFLE